MRTPTLLSILVVLPALACQTDSRASAAAADSPADEMAMEEMMARYMELAEPGEHHALLAPFVGTFTFEARMRMGPDAPWSPSAGTMTTRWVLGERFQLSEYESTSAEMGSFQGLGLLGYDNAKERYVSVWVDTWGTMIPPAAEGTMEGNVLTMTNSFVNPVTGATERYRDVTTIVDDDTYTFEMFTPGPDGELYRNLEIRYTRR
jgi:hypothetical protein